MFPGIIVWITNITVVKNYDVDASIFYTGTFLASLDLIRGNMNIACRSLAKISKYEKFKRRLQT